MESQAAQNLKKKENDGNLSPRRNANRAKRSHGVAELLPGAAKTDKRKISALKTTIYQITK